jgi:hypothetical protein
MEQMITFRKRGKSRNLMISASRHLKDLSKKRSTLFINRRRSLPCIGKMSKESKMPSLIRTRFSWTMRDAWRHPSTYFSRRRPKYLPLRCNFLISMIKYRKNKTKIRNYSSNYQT